jgi:hypothetical protein
MTSRSAHRGEIEIDTLDITMPKPIAPLRLRLVARDDLLFVNAGASDDPAETIGEVAREEFVANALSPMPVIQAPRDLVAVNGLGASAPLR